MDKREQNKQENKRAMKKLVPITIAVGIVGGIIGGVAVFDSTQNTAEWIKSLLGDFAYTFAPWGVVLVSVLGIAISLYLYKTSTKIYENNLPEDPKEEMEEELFDKVERSLSMAMIVNSFTMVMSFTLYGVMIAYFERYFIDDNIVSIVVALVAFIASVLGQAKIQQILTDFIKIMHPDKLGSTYDFKFSEKWEESCDELEKLMIYKSAFKAYKTTNLTCCIALVVMILLSMYFHYGPLPAVIVGVIWLTLTMSYSLEAMRLDKK